MPIPGSSKTPLPHSSVRSTNGSAPPVGLVIPEDLDEWRTWAVRTSPGRALIRRLTARHDREDAPIVLTTGSSKPSALLVLDGWTPSVRSSLVEPLRHLDASEVAILDHRARPDLLDEGAHVQTFTSVDDAVAVLGSIPCAVMHGDYLPLGAVAHRAMRSGGGRTIVVQHGLMTPFAPPLPQGSHLLAFSAADGEFWRSGRDDVSVEVVGSQMLWHAEEDRTEAVGPDARPIFLGQLHAAEFDRRELAEASLRFCRRTGAHYRPHPAEADRISKLYHAWWRRRGVVIDATDRPLRDLGSPVVAVFSSGVIEAAAAGIPSWGYHPNPPAWLAEFWDRYGISRWGSDPTPAPPRPEIEPAAHIAHIIGGKPGADS